MDPLFVSDRFQSQGAVPKGIRTSPKWLKELNVSEGVGEQKELSIGDVKEQMRNNASCSPEDLPVPLFRSDASDRESSDDDEPEPLLFKAEPKSCMSGKSPSVNARRKLMTHGNDPPASRTPLTLRKPYEPAKIETDNKTHHLLQNAFTFLELESYDKVIFFLNGMLEHLAVENPDTGADGSGPRTLSTEEETRMVSMLCQLVDHGLQEAMRQEQAIDNPVLARTLELCLAACGFAEFQTSLLRSDLIYKLNAVLAVGQLDSRVVDIDPFRLTAMKIITILTAGETSTEYVKHTRAVEIIQSVLKLVRARVANASMQKTSPETREQAARVIKHLSKNEQLSKTVVAQRGVEALLDACQSGSSMTLWEQAARALGNIAFHDANEAHVVGAGGVDALLKMLESANSVSIDSATLLLDAVFNALSNLISNSTVRRKMVNRRCLQLLRPAMASDDERLFGQAGWLLACLAVDVDLGNQVVELGGVEMLVIYASKSNDKYQEEAAWALATLSSRPENAMPMHQADAVRPILRLVQSTSADVQLQALWAIANLAVCDELKVPIGEEDAMRILIETLPRAEGETSLLQATRAIANLVVAPSNCKRIQQLPGGIERLVAALDLPYASVQESVARVFVNMSHEEDMADSLVEAGVIPAIAKLLHVESVQLEAIFVIVNLSLCPRHEAELAVSEVIKPLIVLLQTADSHVRAQAAWALGNMSASTTSKAMLIKFGALGVLNSVADDPNADLNAASLKAIGSLVQMLTPNSRRVYSHRASNSNSNVGHNRERRPMKRSPLSVPVD